MSLRRHLLAFALAAALAGACQPSFTGVRATPTNAYRAYGEYHPVAEDDAVVARAATADPTGKRIRLFQEALPPGIAMQGGTLGVEKGYKHRLIGKYVYSSGEDQPKDALVLRVKKLCVTVGANAALILFHVENAEDRAKAQAIEAVLLHYEDPAEPPAPDGSHSL